MIKIIWIVYRCPCSIRHVWPLIEASCFDFLHQRKQESVTWSHLQAGSVHEQLHFDLWCGLQFASWHCCLNQVGQLWFENSISSLFICQEHDGYDGYKKNMSNANLRFDPSYADIHRGAQEDWPQLARIDGASWWRCHDVSAETRWGCTMSK